MARIEGCGRPAEITATTGALLKGVDVVNERRRGGLVETVKEIEALGNDVQAETLTEWIDPSVRDELNPDDRDPALDIYDASCPHKPPFTKDFVAAFRAAQIARNRKITGWALDLLTTLKRRDSGEMERAFVVHRTMSDVRWIDERVEAEFRPARPQ